MNLLSLIYKKKFDDNDEDKLFHILFTDIDLKKTFILENKKIKNISKKNIDILIEYDDQYIYSEKNEKDYESKTFSNTIHYYLNVNYIIHFYEMYFSYIFYIF